MSNKFHYVYQITEKSTNKKYIGCRSSIKEPTKDLGIIYFSSSTDRQFVKNQKINTENFIYEVISIHDNREDALQKEIVLHNMYDVGVNNMFFNKVKQTSKKFTTHGLKLVKDEYGKYLFINKNDDMPNNLMTIFSGKTVVKDKDDNIFHISVDDPRYLSGELIHINTDKIIVKDANDNKFMIDRNDPRYLSGELVHNFIGKTVAKDKDGNIFHISVDDPRYLSGELIHNNCGTKLKEETKRKISIATTGSKNPMYGRKHTLEAKKKQMNKARCNKARCKKVFIDGIIYESRKEAAKQLNIKTSVVTFRCYSDLFESWYYIKKDS